MYLYTIKNINYPTLLKNYYYDKISRWFIQHKNQGGAMLATRTILSAISGALVVAAFVPYIRAILRKETKPAKVSWLIWSCLETITVAGMFAKHAINGQIVGSAVGNWVVLILALKSGKAGWSILDKLCLGGGVLAIVLWKTLDNPTLAIIMSLSGVFIASVPTLVSAWHNPKNESRAAWTINWASCVLTTLAIPAWNVENVIQPAVFMVVNIAMMFLLWGRRSKLPLPKATARYAE